MAAAATAAVVAAAVAGNSRYLSFLTWRGRASATAPLGLLICFALAADDIGAAEFQSAPAYRAAIPYRESRGGPTRDEVESYRINTFIFADAKGVPYTERPYSDPCYRIYPNQGENVAWLEARVILGLLDMHEATGDPAFLEQIVVHADRVFDCRLDRRNRQLAPRPPMLDTQRNSATFAGWPTWSYTHPRATTNHVSHSVHTAYFVYAVARFVRFVEQRKVEAFRGKAREYLPLLEQSIAAFDAERNEQGLYVFPPSADRGPWRIYVSANEYIDATNLVQPLNMQAAMGLAYCELQGVPGLGAAQRIEYRERATKIARYFRGQLQRNRKRDSYVWPYWSLEPGNAEDVSHAAIDVDFAVATVDARLGVFTQIDLRRFANTLLKVVRDPRAPHSPRSSVDGTGPRNDDSADVVYWMGLARYDRRVYDWLSDLLDQRDLDPSPAIVRGFVANAQGFKYDRDYQAYAARLKFKYARVE